MKTALALALALCVADAAVIGINLGNVLEAPTEGAWAPAAQQYFFDDYVTQNFTRVRIPVRWDKHTGAAPPYAIDAAFLARVQEVVGWSLARNLSTIVNSHHDDWVSSANDTAFAAALPRFVAIWRQVAAAFSGAPATLSFEVANEPVAPLSLASLNAMYAAVLPVVRAQHPTRTVYIGGLSWMSPDWIAKNPDAVVFPKLASGAIDRNIALEVHAYDPYAFCLQTPPTQSTWGTPADVAAVQSQYDGAAAWGAAHGRRVYFGEAGCALSAPSRAGRVKWYATIGDAARTSGVEALTVWDDDGSFKLYDRAARTWDTELLAALFGRA